MALDGIFLHSVLCELKSNFLGAKVDKVNQPEKDEIILTIRGKKSTEKLLISASASCPKIHIIDYNKPNPITAPMFCMVLRKYLNSAKIVDIRQVETDRIIVMDFESTDELGFNSIYSLVIEIMGRHSNITLIRQRDNIIMDSIKHVTPDMNTYRCLYSGINFVYPPPSDRLNPFKFDENSFNLAFDNVSINEKMFSSIFTGVSTPLSKEIYYRIMKKQNSVEKAYAYSFCESFFSKIKNSEFSFNMYSLNGVVKDFYCIELLSLEDFEKTHFQSASKIIQDFYFEKDRHDRLNSKSSDLQRLVNTNLDRCNKKIKILNDTLEECEGKDIYKIKGELLTANIYNIKHGMAKIKVLNYYSENDDYIEINLDINKTPSENIQKYFKKYTKLKKSEEAAVTQLEYANDELNYLQSVLTNIVNADNYTEIEEIKNELIDTGYIKFKKNGKNKKAKASKPMHFISSDGIHIYVGKNNYQNDFLTLKFAEKHDMWLHTKNIPGSHVIIKKFGEIPETTLGEAASLAAYYSKGREGTKIAVDYTEVRNVKKPSGSKPGMVIYYTNKTLYMDPKSPEELKLVSEK